MSFKLPDLPYGYDALEPSVDAQTMQIHHTKHHATYVNNVNAALAKFPEFQSTGIIDLNKAVGANTLPTDIATAIRNNGGGHYNHSFFWKVMTNPSSTNGPSAALKEAIDSSFGSLDEFKSKFNAAAAGRFGSGWAWLNVKDGKLAISSTPNQDNPLMDGSGIPVLGLDVWEHAYYLKYQNRRPEYIANWWNVVNWEQVSANYETAKKGEVVAV